MGFKVYRLSLAKNGPSNLSIPFPLPLVHLAPETCLCARPCASEMNEPVGETEAGWPTEAGFWHTAEKA